MEFDLQKGVGRTPSLRAEGSIWLMKGSDRNRAIDSTICFSVRRNVAPWENRSGAVSRAIEARTSGVRLALPPRYSLKRVNSDGRSFEFHRGAPEASTF